MNAVPAMGFDYPGLRAVHAPPEIDDTTRVDTEQRFTREAVFFVGPAKRTALVSQSVFSNAPGDQLFR
jgi:hypothetical protein